MADEDLNGKIMQIVGMLGKEKMPDGVASLISSFIDSAAKSGPKNQEGDSDSAGSQRTQEGSQNGPQDGPQNGNPRRETGSAQYGSNSDPDSNDDTIRLLMTLVEGMRSTDDYRIKFLTSIRPLLNKKRQDKVSSCIQILKLAKMSKTILSSSNNAESGEGM